MKIFSFLFLLLFAISGFCNEATDLEFEIKVKTTLYQSSLQTQLYLADNLQLLDKKNLSLTESSIDEILRKISTTDEFAKDPKLRSKVKDLLKNLLFETRATARKEGVGLALLIGLNSTLGYISPVVLTAIGLLQLILPTTLLLSSAVNVPLTLTLKKAIARVKLIRLYGGRENYKKIQELKKTLRKEYGLDGDSLMFDVDDDLYFKVSSKFGIVDKVKSLFFRNVINPFTLKRTLKKNNLWNGDLAKINRSDIDSAVRSILMIDYVVQHFPDGKKVLQQHFPKHYFEKLGLDVNSELIKWSSKLLAVASAEELMEWSKGVPSTATALEVTLLWKDVFLPHLIKNTYGGVRLRTYRHWVKKLNIQVSKAELNPSALWDAAWAQQFHDYLKF